MSNDRPRAAPVIPLLVFAAIDIALAVFLLVDGGFSIQFWVVALIGLVLAFLGLRSIFFGRLLEPEPESASELESE